MPDSVVATRAAHLCVICICISMHVWRAALSRINIHRGFNERKSELLGLSDAWVQMCEYISPCIDIYIRSCLSFNFSARAALFFRRVISHAREFFAAELSVNLAEIKRRWWVCVCVRVVSICEPLLLYPGVIRSFGFRLIEAIVEKLNAIDLCFSAWLMEENISFKLTSHQTLAR